MGLFVTFQSPPDEYANHLAVPQPERLRLPPAHWLLLILFLLCLVPRVGMALRIPSVCPDGVLYIHIAQSLEAGDWQSASRDMGLNIYPLILTALHRTGLNWELAAGLWGVTVSSLVVLPLWGWVRRQFDDRIALVACLLYAVNPKFIEWSPEVMRDPTFWLLFMLAIYWLWRAVTEVHCGYFVAAGMAIILASLTRIEGLFLLIPFTLWIFWRFLALGHDSEGAAVGVAVALPPLCRKTGDGSTTAIPTRVVLKQRLSKDRKKLLLGAVLCVVVLPALLLAINVGWACGHSGWAALRLSPLARVLPWLTSLLGHAPAQAVADGLEKPLGPGRMIWVFIPTMTRGLSPVFALLMFGGMWGWRRVWARRDHQALFYTAIVIMCGIWVQLWYDRNICPRYALPIVLMASPFAALGLLGLIARLLRIANWLRWGTKARQIVVAAVAAMVAIISLSDAMTSYGRYFRTRQMALDLGCWVHDKYPTLPAIVGPVGITPIVSFYAHNAPYRPFRWEADDDSILAMVEQSRASVVLLQPAKELTEERCAALAARLKVCGLQPVDQSVLPVTCDGLSVLVRTEQNPRVVRGSSRVY
jgi:4-amino-4-deoxy-L-arabinose transferase-like glycosyltransferase